MKTTDKPGLLALKNRIVEIQSLMIAFVTGERAPGQPAEYQELYYQLDIELEELGYPNPNEHRSLESFWSFCKMTELGTYASRRAYVRELYSDILIEIERSLRHAKDPRNWERANKELTDELAPVKRQWLKAKSFIHSTPPDYENSIKESVNSVESALKILTGNSKSTLGQLLKQVDIDKDIQRILSQTYGLVSNKAFVRHGATEAEDIGKEEAQFFIELAATAIVYLKSKLRDRHLIQSDSSA